MILKKKLFEESLNILNSATSPLTVLWEIGWHTILDSLQC